MFEVRVTKQPQRYLKKAHKKTAEALTLCFEKLEQNPFIIAEPLHGPLKGKWKVRVGELRVIMDIDVHTKIVKVFYLGPRGDSHK